MTDDERAAEKLRALTERQKGRQAEIGRRRAERLDGADPTESHLAFFDQFKIRREEVEAAVAATEGITDRAALTAEFARVLGVVRDLQQYLSDSVRFLPAYDVQQSQKQVDGLRAAVAAAQEARLPRKKFAFKARKKKAAEEPRKDRANISAAPISAAAAAASSADKLVVAGEPGATVRLTPAEVEGKDVEIAGLSGCRVELAGQPNTFHIRGLVDCTVCVGPVSRSLLISDCKRCRFWIACQQLRVHTTTETDFYLHVTSRAIIEDCTTVRFAPYNWEYPELDAHYATSGLDRGRNAWDDVDDFMWITPDAPSPNWSVLPEADRVAP